MDFSGQIMINVNARSRREARDVIVNGRNLVRNTSTRFALPLGLGFVGK